MPNTDELRAALAVAELEEQLLAAKDGDGASHDLKLELREARRVYRKLREGYPAADGEARPATIETTGEVN